LTTADTGRDPADRIAAALESVIDGLVRRDWALICAESCTGGWVAKVCTDRPGSSRWFDRGLVTYSNEAKQELLGVAPTILAAAGAVSQPCAEAMAEGARGGRDDRVSVAVTGIAGPEGGSAEKPVGLVWFAWALPQQTLTSEAVHLTGDREAIRLGSVAHALDGLARRLAA